MIKASDLNEINGLFHNRNILLRFRYQSVDSEYIRVSVPSQESLLRENLVSIKNERRREIIKKLAQEEADEQAKDISEKLESLGVGLNK